MQRKREVLQARAIRSCGGFGNGTQTTGGQFSNTVVLYGNDLSTFPDIPAEIRVPVGKLPGVSGFQVRSSSHEFHTPGDSVAALVVLNPAARKRDLPDLKPAGILIVNADEFGKAICTRRSRPRIRTKSSVDLVSRVPGGLPCKKVCKVPRSVSYLSEVFR